MRYSADGGAKIAPGSCLQGDMQRGWTAGWNRIADPPNTIDGWAGWLAAHIVLG